jgi:hypothetical protein
MTIELEQLILERGETSTELPSRDRLRAEVTITSDGKTLHQEEVVSSRALGIALVASALAAFATLIALLVLLVV